MSTKLNFSGKVRLIIRNGVGKSGILDENSIIIKALKKLEDYQRIGTRQQCREWKEKSMLKKTLGTEAKTLNRYCPNCVNG